MTRLATFFPKFPVCGRCDKEILANPTYYDGKAWYHLACWEEGERELQEAQARADEFVKRFGFATLPIPAARRNRDTPLQPALQPYRH